MRSQEGKITKIEVKNPYNFLIAYLGDFIHEGYFDMEHYAMIYPDDVRSAVMRIGIANATWDLENSKC